MRAPNRARVSGAFRLGDRPPSDRGRLAPLPQQLTAPAAVSSEPQSNAKRLPRLAFPNRALGPAARCGGLIVTCTGPGLTGRFRGCVSCCRSTSSTGHQVEELERSMARSANVVSRATASRPRLAFAQTHAALRGDPPWGRWRSESPRPFVPTLARAGCDLPRCGCRHPVTAWQSRPCAAYLPRF